MQERQRVYMEHLPGVVGCYAGEWLTSQLNTASNRGLRPPRMLANVAFLPEGQQGGFPGLGLLTRRLN